jgi:TolB-like protein
MSRWLTLLATLATIAAGPLPESAPAEAGTNSKVVAVLAFDNGSGDARYDPLGKGIAAMMITDLSQLSILRLVERERLQDLITELDLQQTRHFDPATAQRVGRIAGAEYVVTGTLTAIQPRVRIDSRVIRVETGEIVKTASVLGREDRFFELQERLADELMDGLEIALSPEELERFRQQQEANRLAELEHMLMYSEALARFDREDYVGAAEKMYGVMQAAPESVVVRMTYDMMRDRAARQTQQRARTRVNRWIRDRVQ